MTDRRELVHGLLDDAADAWPERVAIETKDDSITFARLREAALVHACALGEMGVGPGARVVVEAENTIDVVSVIFAVLALGAAFSPIHPSTPVKQRAYIADNAGAVLSVRRQEGELVAESAAGVALLPAFEATAPLAEGPNSLAEVQPGTISEDLACLIYTSGSTGAPKGVTCLHRQVTFAVRAIAECLDYRAEDKIFAALPLSFDYGLYQVFLGLATGAMLHLADPRVAGLTLFKELAATRATILPAVPPMLDNLATLGRRRADSLRALRLITNTGAAAVPATVATLRQSFPNLRFQLMYGLTECKRATICPPDADLDRPGTCGLPLRDTEVRIVDEEGNALPPGEVGEIAIRGPHVMAGYWNDAEETARRYVLRNATMRELRSGDYGWLDDGGYLYCEGRRDDIFKQRGFRVSCSEIEAAALAIDGIKHAVLIPPSGKKPSVLLVCFDDGEFDVIAHLSDALEEYKLPARCMALPHFPTTANGKFDRRTLRDIAHGEKSNERGAVQ